MKVIEKAWSHEREYALEELLSSTLQSQNSERGALEDVEKRCQVMADAIGKILALLVESKRISLEAAYSICGGYHDIREVK